MSILAFGVGNSKRNPEYRSLSAVGLIGLAQRVCSLGSFKVTVTPIGQASRFSWKLPATTELPLAAYVVDAAKRRSFVETWSFEEQDPTKPLLKLKC